MVACLILVNLSPFVDLIISIEAVAGSAAGDRGARPMLSQHIA
jgi:hypothetical protein